MKITVVKDRHGALREHAAEGKHIATMRVASTGDGVTVTLEPPATAAAHSDAFRPTVLMERVSLALEQEPGLTRNAVRDTVKGKATYIDLALELLTAEGFIEARPDGQARRHHVLTAYRQLNDPLADATESPGSQPSPNRVPDPAKATGSPGPTPTRGTRYRTR